jgi:murein DD-endopeptidase MepM/ murein hydrolase activator NlpD
MMLHPLRNKDTVITSPYGNRLHPVTGGVKFHNGVDLRAAENTPIYSPADGQVTGELENSAGGVQMIITHDNGYKTGYAHLNKRLARKGQRVKEGQQIALSGNTGRSTAPHLHFTVKNPQGERIDPAGLMWYDQPRTGGQIGVTIFALVAVGLVGYGLYRYYAAKN